MSRRPARAALKPAYVHTSYIVDAEGREIGVRIGEPSPELDGLLARWNAKSGTFITAANPRSERWSADANRAALRRLAARLAEDGRRALAHRGVGDDGNWPPEHGFFVLDLAEADAVRLAEAFGQYAVVIADLGRAPRLVFTSLAEEPRQS